MQKSKKDKVDPKNPNPISEADKVNKRIEPELETDTFGIEEMADIVSMVTKDYERDKDAMQGWLKQRERDINDYMGEKPSKLENITKEEWQSDRNLGLCTAVCDTFHAVLLATCWNPETIHGKPTEKNDVDNSDNIVRFTKWGIGKNESNIYPEIDDYLQNKITQGFGAFKIYWKVWYDWVDKRIPIYDEKDKNRKKIKRYDIKTEKMRFEKGVIENISDVDDLLFPNYGKNLQDCDHLIHVLHLTGAKVLDNVERKIFKNIDEEKIEKLKRQCFDSLEQRLGKEKLENLGLKTPDDVSDLDLRALPIDVLEWYGPYEKNGKKEEYRFTIEPSTKTFLSGKPLRKITRTGKRPFVGGGFARIAGQIKGRSLPSIIFPITSAFNNVYNQKSDFQYVQNCPFGFYVPNEGYTQQEFKLTPGVMFPVDEEPANKVYFPHLTRSLAWAKDDIQILFEVLERLTGSASYFLTSQSKTGVTATRDAIVNEKSESRFGLWVKRVISDIGEALTMYVQMYQDWAPPNLGERVLGEDGRSVIRNLSIDSLRGQYDLELTPDLTAGSKAMDRQMKLWGLQTLNQSMWVHPQVNPRGNWNLFADTMKAMGYQDVERYIGEQPPQELGTSTELADEWARFLQGEEVEITPNENPLEHLIGHLKHKDEKYHELPDEYKPNFDRHLFETQVRFREFIKNMQQEMIANRLAMGMTRNAPPQGAMPQGQPGGMPNAMPGGGNMPQGQIPEAQGGGGVV